MLILGIEASSRCVSAAILQNDTVVCENFLNIKTTHSTTLMSVIDNCFKETGYTIGDINLIASSVGPGSFTGVRIGISTAKGLAFPKGINTFGVSSLEGLAYNIDPSENNEKIICSVVDGKCKQIYRAYFKYVKDGIERVTEDRMMTLDELSKEILNMNNKITLIGEDSKYVFENLGLEENNVTYVHHPVIGVQKASSIALAAYHEFIISGVTNDLRPEYLQLSQAERNYKVQSKKNDIGMDKNLI